MRALDWAECGPEGFIEGFTHVADEPTRLSALQREIVNDVTSPLRHIKKSRQIGFSFAMACQGLYLALTRKGYKMIFISHTLDDAAEKILFARQLYESLPEVERRRIPLTRDRQLSLGWANESRLISQFMPRGKGEADLVFDELAHIKRDREIWAAGVPTTLRGGGRRVITGSSVRGKSGVFWEIDEGHEGKHVNWRRSTYYWWQAPELCVNVPKAVYYAPDMTTEERVREFGTPQLVNVAWDVLPLEDFQMEMEARYVDEATAFFPWELIRRCQMDTDPGEDPEGVSEAEAWRCHSAVELAEKATGFLYAGFDVGRVRDASELTVFELVGGKAYERYWVTLERKEFEEQEAVLDGLLLVCKGKVERLRIDATPGSLGMQLAENMQKRHGTVVEKIGFTRVLKEQMCNDFKIWMERGNIALYPDRKRLAQIHSIKRKVSASGNFIFDAERNERHHADVFWSQALALSAIPDEARRPRPLVLTVSQKIGTDGYFEPVEGGPSLIVAPRRESEPAGDSGPGPDEQREERVRRVMARLKKRPDMRDLSDATLRGWAEQYVDKDEDKELDNG